MRVQLQAQIAQLLRDGYGAEDIAIKLEIDPDNVRNAISDWRLKWGLFGILEVSVQKNRRALEIMGVISPDPSSAA